jgi:hypothetical protein
VNALCVAFPWDILEKMRSNNLFCAELACPPPLHTDAALFEKAQQPVVALPPHSPAHTDVAFFFVRLDDVLVFESGRINFDAFRARSFKISFRTQRVTG